MAAEKGVILPCENIARFSKICPKTLQFFYVQPPEIARTDKSFLFPRGSAQPQAQSLHSRKQNQLESFRDGAL